MPALLFFRKGGKIPMNKLKKRATALLLGSVTFFIALAMPYNTTRVYAVDVAFSWVVNESSNTILNWILLYLGISVVPEAISEGKVFDKTGEFALDFCNEFFGDTFEQWYISNGIGDDVDTFKKAVDDVLTTDWSSVGDAVASIPSDILDTIYQYLNVSSVSYACSDLSFEKVLTNDVAFDVDFTLSYREKDKYEIKTRTASETGYKPFTIRSDSVVRSVLVVYFSDSYIIRCASSCVSAKPYQYLNSDGVWKDALKSEDGSYYWGAGSGFDFALPDYSTLVGIASNIPVLVVPWAVCKNIPYVSGGRLYGLYLRGFQEINDIPDISGKDWAFDQVGWPNTWAVDKPDVKPWDGVDSLPIPGDAVLGDSIPGVIDFPDVIQKIIDGTIPWPDVIGAVRDIDIPAPDPDPDEPDKKPEPDPELPEIPAVLPQGVSDKLKDLSGKFPFCIPFDVVDCYKSFATKDNAEAPKWDIDFTIPGTNQKYHFSVDLAMFDKYIPIFRSGVLILFFIGLLLATRKLIGWQIDN